MTDSLPAPRQLPTTLLTGEMGWSAARSGVRSGHLIRVRKGAYVTADKGRRPWQQAEVAALARCVALSRVLTAEYVFSHVTAALIHGCWIGRADEQTHITQPVRPSARRSPGLRRHVVPLAPEDVTVVNGLRVTTLERTIVDCARSMHPRDGLLVVDSALRMLTLPDRWERAASLARIATARRRLLQRLEQYPGRRGITRARAVIAYADPFSESAGESSLRWIAVSRGLPRPRAQHRVDTPRGTYFTDLAWLFHRYGDDGQVAAQHTLHAEFDGSVKYTGPAEHAAQTVYAEKLREDAIRRRGDTVLRFVWSDLWRQEAVLRSLCQAFPARSVERLKPVVGLVTAADLAEGA